MNRLVTTIHLEMTSPSDLRPAPKPMIDCDFVRVPFPMPQLNRFFYTTVGGDWFWVDRLPWTHQQWLMYLDRPEMETWLVTVGGVPAGYCELELQGADVEIAYFGILAAFAGRGLGAWALTRAIETGWQRATNRVWVHTCDLDHPAALRNYLSRGFREFKRESKEEIPTDRH